MDAQGNIVDGDQILYIIAKDRHQRGVLHGGVVGTLMSNYGLELAISHLGIPFIRSKVVIVMFWKLYVRKIGK